MAAAPDPAQCCVPDVLTKLFSITGRGGPICPPRLRAHPITGWKPVPLCAPTIPIGSYIWDATLPGESRPRRPALRLTAHRSRLAANQSPAPGLLEAARRTLGKIEAVDPGRQLRPLDPGVQGLDGLVITAADLCQGDADLVIGQGRVELVRGDLVTVAGRVLQDDLGRQQAVDVAFRLLRQA